LPQKRGDTETMPHVARELSWELARYLEAQDSPEDASSDASAASNSAGGGPGWTRDEERLAGRGRDKAVLGIRAQTEERNIRDDAIDTTG
jgi:hypothetical protein